MGYHISLVSNVTNKDDQFEYSDIKQKIEKSSRFKIFEDDGKSFTIIEKKGKGEFGAFYNAGYIWISTSQDEEIDTFIKLAEFLECRARGDEGETYKTVNNVYYHPGDLERIENNLSPEMKKNAVSVKKYNIVIRAIQIVGTIIFLSVMFLIVLKKLKG
ncbi:hypothetical protein [Sulfurovum mangrovi]|uniref:hypothetical protein n=1 Tax=Sulfurovum mangrovi TaxID=2893889 RepID=UPI001E521ED4|nr:hypothetical protein [Sulfurovum mangrovi]UFH59489.1 hypothetical protein LN246_01250 [Sulfurovum mangrovi]UFH60641.1 hypothetical protein LN246_13790 [Sulfurovum mangrovi]